MNVVIQTQTGGEKGFEAFCSVDWDIFHLEQVTEQNHWGENWIWHFHRRKRVILLINAWAV